MASVLLPWPDKRCTLCLSDAEKLSRAHIIPVALGGRLVVPCLCQGCNSSLGSGAEAGLKSDPAIRLALAALEDDFPAVAAITDRQLFVAEEEGVRVRARRNGGDFDVLDTPQDGDSWVKSDERAIAEIETVLRRRGMGDQEISVARGRAEAAPRGVRVGLAPGLAIKKNTTSSFVPDLTASLTPDTCFLAAAYLYLALYLGKAVYHGILQPIRDAILGAQVPKPWTVTPLIASDRGYQPWHGLCLLPGTTGLCVEIRLFGVLSWMVCFEGVGIPPGNESWAYKIDLASGRDTWRRCTADDEVCADA